MQSSEKKHGWGEGPSRNDPLIFPCLGQKRKDPGGEILTGDLEAKAVPRAFDDDHLVPNAGRLQSRDESFQA